jgi:2',3'-cyclic-nucleotide 2'-phosphodiesterase (5'-nucleotidase family)
MNTRRKFLFGSSMATAALLTAKPFTTIANSLSPVTGFSINNNSLVLAHTGNAIHAGTGHTLQQITQLKNSAANLMMLHAGDAAPARHTAYDASMHTGESFSICADDYKIVYKGDIKTGVITANNKSASADTINALAVYLKKEKNCHLVVCLSQLGYKSETGLDDLSLAANSTNLDIIIGGHATNFCKSPMTTLNKNKEEVIINHAGTSGLALRKIEIGFDNRGRKNQLAFTRTSLPA